MGRIVLTTDFSPESERAFAPAMDLASKLGHSVTLLHVVEDLEVTPRGAALAPKLSPPSTGPALEKARQQLEKRRAELGLRASTAVVAAPDVAQAIADFAAREGAAFIMLSTHGRTGLRHLVLGSVAESVVRHATVPVVCFPMAHPSE